MKKILYFTFLDLDAEGKEGLIKKINNQAKAMQKYEEVAIAYPQNGSLLVKALDGEIVKYPLGLTFDKFNHRDSLIRFFKKSDFLKDFDTIYIRNFMMIDFFTLKIYRLFSKHAEVILEIPTFPFDKEIKTFQKQFIKERHYLIFTVVTIFTWMHIFGKNRLKKYVKTITTFNPVEEIWGIPTIVLQNAASVPELLESDFPVKTDDGKVVFVGVGSFVAWHGFDRFIKGIPEYLAKNKKDLEFNIIGYGPDLPQYEELVASLGLSDKVTFKGILTGEALTAEYLKADFAVGSLGIHRLDLDKASPIKTKEYFSYGLPFIYDYKEDDFLENSKYSLKVARDESPINIDEVIEFYEQIKDEKAYRLKMNQLAKENLTWASQMAKVFE